MPLDNISQSFQKAFPKADHFRAACAVCMLLEDNLLTAAQVRACGARCLGACVPALGLGVLTAARRHRDPRSVSPPSMCCATFTARSHWA